MYFLGIVIKLVLAGLLGGIIGYERENTLRPAGFRTHILVCVGASLVMITSKYIFEQYSSHVNIDPARLGAQVISGIGFLGAGTIIRDGFNVKGLTTAASLWAVSCVGIATGIGFYSGAVIATMIIFSTLLFLKKFEKNISNYKRYNAVFIQSENHPGRIGEINGIFEKYNVTIRNIEVVNSDNKENVLIKLLVRFVDSINSADVIEELQKLAGIVKVYVK